MNNPSKQVIEAIQKISAKIDGQIKIVALTGSGISKGSGIPTFRGKDGLWRNYDAMQLATPQAFSRNPKLVWEWYAWRMGIILEKAPNPAHLALVDLEKHGYLQWIITQNVDNLHKKAGSKNIIQVHGDIFHAWCQSCGYSLQLVEPPKSPPTCNCGNLLRPGVIWFGESLNRSDLMNAYRIITEECDVLLVIGTSGLVYPIAAFPQDAKLAGSLVIEFNIEPTPISEIADYSVFGKSEETLAEFVQTLIKKKD
ncbi:MAG: NAD-dependent deacylase [Asgard group archaeon]|nr:NAD-dependent deacylase [Asgard group archaeon]